MQESEQHPMLALIDKIEDPLQRQLFQNLIEKQQQNRIKKSSTISLEKAVNDVKQLMTTCKYQQTQLEELTENLQVQQNVLETAAKALGACTCLGLNATCSNCDGKGKPGTYEIEENSFNALILPLLTKLQDTINREIPKSNKKNGTINKNINNN